MENWNDWNYEKVRLTRGKKTTKLAYWLSWLRDSLRTTSLYSRICIDEKCIVMNIRFQLHLNVTKRVISTTTVQAYMWRVWQLSLVHKIPEMWSYWYSSSGQCKAGDIFYTHDVLEKGICWTMFWLLCGEGHTVFKWAVTHYCLCKWKTVIC